MYISFGNVLHFIISCIKIEYAVGSGSVYVSAALGNMYIKRILLSISVTTNPLSNENTTLSPNVQKSDFDGLHSVRYSDKRDRLF